MELQRLKIGRRVVLVVRVDGNYVSVDELLKKDIGSVDIDKIFDLEEKIRGEISRKNYSYVKFDNFTYAPAVGYPGKLIFVGLNYRSHVAETERKIPEHPVLFSKFPNALAGHLENITIPEEGLKVDYEGELGVIIGKHAKDVGDDYEKYIFGYFIGNDVSSRELQYRTSQYLLGKTLDGFFPNGPSIVTRDEIADPQNLRIRTKVNGSTRQDSSTENMIFPIGKLVSYISHYFTLEPGDIISTGTPEGVIMGMKDKESAWLKKGDVVEVSIEGLGTLRNAFV